MASTTTEQRHNTSLVESKQFSYISYNYSNWITRVCPALAVASRSYQASIIAES